MTFLDQGLLKKARDFIDTHLSEGGSQEARPILIAYHGDGDGCCAAYFLQRYLKRPARFYWVPTPDFDFAKAEEYAVGQMPSLTLFLDMPVNNRPDMIEKLLAQGKVFVYDHHQPEKQDLPDDRPGFLYINPVIHQNGKAFPTALFGWEMLKEKAAHDKEVLFMGLFTETWLERVRIFQEFGPGHRDRLKEMAKRIHTSFLVQDMSTIHHALDFLLQAGGDGRELYAQIQSAPQYQILENIYGLVESEKGWIMRGLDGEIKRLTAPKCIFKRVESGLRLSGLIASELRWKHPHLVIGIWQRWKERYICELRRGEACRIDLSRLIGRVRGQASLLSGGGHPMAAAFIAEGKDFFHALRSMEHLIAEDTDSLKEQRKGGKDSSEIQGNQ